MLRSKESIVNPFVGPRSFKRDLQDQRIFFGRDDETEEIVSPIFSHQLVLVYAQSGAGKTSIFKFLMPRSYLPWRKTDLMFYR